MSARVRMSSVKIRKNKSWSFSSSWSQECLQSKLNLCVSYKRVSFEGTLARVIPSWTRDCRWGIRRWFREKKKSWYFFDVSVNLSRFWRIHSLGCRWRVKWIWEMTSPSQQHPFFAFFSLNFAVKTNKLFASVQEYEETRDNLARNRNAKRIRSWWRLDEDLRWNESWEGLSYDDLREKSASRWFSDQSNCTLQYKYARDYQSRSSRCTKKLKSTQYAVLGIKGYTAMLHCISTLSWHE